MRFSVTVGDDWQSIYGFRGANLSVFLGFHKLFPGVRRFYLEDNYRSLRPIVKAGNRLIERSAGQMSKVVRAQRGRGPGLPVVSMALNPGIEAEFLDSLQGIDPESWRILCRSNYRVSRWLASGAGQKQCMTIHRSKGLEFPIVFFDAMGGWSGGDRDEELRTAYVGISRAENMLVFLHRPLSIMSARDRLLWQEWFEPLARPVGFKGLLTLLRKETRFRQECSSG